jgi:hypothetical protein
VIFENDAEVDALVAFVNEGRTPPTEEEIEAARTSRGGWTRAQLARWGVPWPPPRGWKKALVERGDQR